MYIHTNGGNETRYEFILYDCGSDHTQIQFYYAGTPEFLLLRISATTRQDSLFNVSLSPLLDPRLACLHLINVNG